MKRRIVAALCVIAGSVVPGTVSRAEDETVEISTTNQVHLRRQETNHKGVSAIFDSEGRNGASYISGGVVGSVDGGLCETTKAPPCVPPAGRSMSVTSVLGACESTAEIGCIEGLATRTTSGELVPLVKVAGGETVFPEDDAISVPRGTTLTTWEDPSGRRYVVNATVVTIFAGTGAGSWLVGDVELEVQITRIQRGTTQPPTTAAMIPDPATGKPTLSYVGSVGNSPNARAVPLVVGTRFNLRLRVPNTVSGWFQGRIANAVVGSKSLTGNRTVYEVEGDVMSTYVAGALVPDTHPNYSDLPQAARERSSSVINYPPNDLRYYDTWNRFFEGDKAFTAATKWTLKSISTASGKCFSGSSGLSGVASTNAAFYQSGVPAFDAKTGSFDYKVASLHYDQNGALAKGSYSLSIPLAALRCLYGVSIDPSVARVSVEYADGQEPSIAVKSVSVKDGWVNVSHTGFTYSAPTIRTTFGVVASDTGSTNQGNFSSLMARHRSSSSVTTTIRGSRATLTITLGSKQTVRVFRKVGKKMTLLKTFSGKKGVNRFTTSYRKPWTFVVLGKNYVVIPPKVTSSGASGAGLTRLS